jgi:hypothetical protein
MERGWVLIIGNYSWAREHSRRECCIKVLLTRRLYAMNKYYVVILQIIIFRSNGQGSKEELVELAKTIKNLQREVQSHWVGNEKLI